MIPLVTSLITAYFALLKFLGIEKIQATSSLNPDTLIEPTIILLYSLIVFIIGIFPVGWKFTFGNYNSLANFRNVMLGWKFVWASIGSILFLIGVFKIMMVVKEILYAI